jgi:hypothetical protein
MSARVRTVDSLRIQEWELSMVLKPVAAVGIGLAAALIAALPEEPTGWLRVWQDVWDVVGPLVTLGAGGLITYYLRRLSEKQGAAAVAADLAKDAATAAAEKAKDAAIVAQTSAQERERHLRAQDAKLAEIHNAIEYTLSDAAQRVAVAANVAQAQTDHLAAQDQTLDQIHTAVNSQKTELERVNQALRDALQAAGVTPPPGTEPPTDRR